MTVTLGAGAVGLGLWSAEPPQSGPIGRGPAPEPRIQLAALDAATLPGASETDDSAEAGPATVAQTMTVARGDTLMGLLVKAGIDRQEAHEAIAALREVFQPRDLRPGQDIQLFLAPAAGQDQDGAEPGPRLVSFGLQPSVERSVRVWRGEDAGFVVEEIARPLERRAVAVGGTIDSNLSLAAQDAGLPMPVLSELIRMFSFDVDFQRELRGGDSFEVLYEALFEEDGSLAKPDAVRYAALTLSGQRLELYNFTPRSGVGDFFEPNGQSVRKTLMRTPVDGARLSSGFGMRRHPILGYSKKHTGTDFAAPKGTPIYAAGDGVVETAGWNGGYGKYIRLRHNSTYKTAYAHMSRIAKGMAKGKRVKQGQVIGYVGSTGRSTGAHLHYEVLVSGRQVNPLKVKLPSGEKLKGKDLEAFAARRAEIDALREVARSGGALLVRAECADGAMAEGALLPASGCPGTLRP